jgi:hypothetical protein
MAVMVNGGSFFRFRSSERMALPTVPPGCCVLGGRWGDGSGMTCAEDGDRCEFHVDGDEPDKDD